MKMPERVLIVHPGPQFSVHDVFEGWLEAFSDLGIRTLDYNLQDRLAFYDSIYIWTGDKDPVDGNLKFKKALKDRATVVGMSSNGIMSTAYQFWPDVILIVSAFFIPTETLDILRSRGHKIVLLFTESPYEENRQIQRAAHADLALLNDPLKLSEYDKAGIPAFYMPHAYRPRRHYPGPGAEDLETDFAFVGTGYPSRVEFFEKMQALGAFDGLDVTLAGNWQALCPAGQRPSPLLPLVSHDLNECVDNALTTQIYRSAKIGINTYRRESEDGCADGTGMGPREVEMAACGLFFLREPRPESDEVFDGILPTFAGPEDAAEQLHWWLAHEDAREKATRAAREKIRPRTFMANAQRLLKMLDEL